MTKWLPLLAISSTLAVCPNQSFSDDVPQVVVQDQARIRDHLRAVETYLRERDTSDLSEAQREARSKNIERLHEYWVAGVFPRNTLTGYPTPIFIDPAGRACAVAYLMIQSGWEAAAREVALRENLAYVNDIRSPGVAAWVAQSGLTVQEAAWIQPGYDPCNDECPCDEEPVCGADGMTYVNSCLAESCGQQFVHIPGCCAVADVIYWSGDLIASRICENDPNERTETLCSEAVDPPEPEASAASGCSATPYRSQSHWGQILLLALALLGARRHGALFRLHR
ncbi:MAG: Kazal-type serine protease inhibitor domain-containing protein [Myxococcales bacterium]|nr:Kazal-type serine protease inhibitor domain-containing protein [Myxococcales bacterium]